MKIRRLNSQKDEEYNAAVDLSLVEDNIISVDNFVSEDNNIIVDKNPIVDNDFGGDSATNKNDPSVDVDNQSKRKSPEKGTGKIKVAPKKRVSRRHK